MKDSGFVARHVCSADAEVPDGMVSVDDASCTTELDAAQLHQRL
jgi:hypothetical protein